MTVTYPVFEVDDSGEWTNCGSCQFTEYTRDVNDLLKWIFRRYAVQTGEVAVMSFCSWQCLAEFAMVRPGLIDVTPEEWQIVQDTLTFPNEPRTEIR